MPMQINWTVCRNTKNKMRAVMRIIIVMTPVEKVTIGVGGSCAVAVDTQEFT